MDQQTAAQTIELFDAATIAALRIGRAGAGAAAAKAEADYQAALLAFYRFVHANTERPGQ